MSPQIKNDLYRLKEFNSFVRGRLLVSFSFTIFMCLIYFGFIYIVLNYDETLKEYFIPPFVSLGLSIMIILISWLLVGIYVLWSFLYFDRKIVSLRRKFLDSID